MNSEPESIGFGIILGLVLGLCIFLVRQDFLYKECESKLTKNNSERNKVCDVKLRAIVIDKGDK